MAWKRISCLLNRLSLLLLILPKSSTSLAFTSDRPYCIIPLPSSPTKSCCPLSPLATTTAKRSHASCRRKIRTGNNNLLLMQLRGGSIHSKALGASKNSVFSNDSNDNRRERKERHRRRAIAIALATTYFTVMGAKCALPTVLPLLTSPHTGLTFDVVGKAGQFLGPQQCMAKLLLFSTISVAGGKILLGPIIDYYGGILSLKMILTILALLLGLISVCQSFSLFAVAWCGVDFIFSATWAGCINAVHQSFPEEEWVEKVGQLAAAARTGNATAFAVFASVLHIFEKRGMRQAWRPVFALAAVCQIIPVALLAIFGNGNNNHSNINSYGGGQGGHSKHSKRERSSFRACLATLQKVATTPDFWLQLVNRSVLMIFASFLLFVPVLMTGVYRASTALAAQTASVYALGCLLAVTMGAKLYARLSSRKVAKLLLLGAMLIGATVSSVAQLGHMSAWWQLSVEAAVALNFLWGLSFSVPFYIPPSLYALEKGGADSSATIADTFDIVGFALLAVFNGYVAGIQHNVPSAWIRTFQITTGCSILSLISLNLAVFRE